MHTLGANVVSIPDTKVYFFSNCKKKSMFLMEMKIYLLFIYSVLMLVFILGSIRQVKLPAGTDPTEMSIPA